MYKNNSSKEDINILLINPGCDNFNKQVMRERYNFPPYGLLTLSSTLQMHGYKVDILDVLVRPLTLDQVRNLISSFTKLIVGISTYTETFHLSLELSRLVKSISPESIVILGGIHASFCTDEALHEPAVDYVAIGEGESTIIHLLEYIKYPQYIDIKSIPGIAYHRQGEISINSRRPLIKDLDNLPFPAYKLIMKNHTYSKAVSIITSRGCPGKCIFCASGAYSGTYYRMHSAKYLFSLLFYFYKRIHEYTLIDYMDDTYTVNKKRIKQMSHYIRHNNLRLISACKSRVDILNESLIRLLYDFGCRSIHLGIESADQRVLDSVNKKITVGKCLETIYLLNKYGIRPELSFMIGHPEDTVETIDKTLIMAHEINKAKIGLAFVAISTPFPGTPLHVNAKEFGLYISTKDWRSYNTFKPIYHTKNYSENHLRRAYYLFTNSRKELDDINIVSECDMSSFRSSIAKWAEETKKNKKQYSSYS